MSDEAKRLVDQQAEDEGLWFVAQTAAEGYLQSELRRLHEAVERDALRAQAAPEGWVPMPKDATCAVVAAMQDTAISIGGEDYFLTDKECKALYAAIMLAVAPKEKP